MILSPIKLNWDLSINGIDLASVGPIFMKNLLKDSDMTFFFFIYSAII